MFPELAGKTQPPSPAAKARLHHEWGNRECWSSRLVWTPQTSPSGWFSGKIWLIWHYDSKTYKAIFETCGYQGNLSALTQRALVSHGIGRNRITDGRSRWQKEFQLFLGFWLGPCSSPQPGFESVVPIHKVNIPQKYSESSIWFHPMTYAMNYDICQVASLIFT